MYWWERFSGLHPREKIRRVYANFRSAAGGCDGATGFGFNGCLNVTSLFLLFQAIGLRGKNVVDLGAGEGRVLASAMKFGAKSVVGYELPANSAHKFVYDAVLRRIFAGIDFNLIASVAQWLAKDIDQVSIDSSKNCVVFFLELIFSRLSAHWTSRRNGSRLLILEWNALSDPGSHSCTFSQLPNCPQTRSISRWKMEYAQWRLFLHWHFDYSPFSLVTPALISMFLLQWFKY